MGRTLDIAVFGSGRGSNFQAILDAIQQGRIPGARICLVVSNNARAGILEIARSSGVPAEHLSEKAFASETAFVDYLLATLRKHSANFIVLAGYMKRLHQRIIEAYRNRIINIHPALLPRYGGQGMYGMHVHEAVIAARERFSGATVHVVDEQYDHGRIILQRRIPVSPDDSSESLAAKVLKIEHELYPEAIRMFAEGNVEITDNDVAVHY
ncbi:MAG: phosphoribosylglycinamide formyltransferase [Ignavibacteriae bacterium]|nr:phosphoribosylglycinamide formyltransferase [Ignavibacteriota bacterium]